MGTKKYASLILIAGAIVAGAVGGYSWGDKNGQSPREITSFWPGYSATGGDSITCEYPQLTYAKYSGETISHELPEPETQPLIFTYSNTGPNSGNLASIDSTRTIRNTPLIKIFENDDRISYIEGNGNAYFAIHTLYPQKGVSTYIKSVDLLGTPSASSGIGKCNSSL